MTATDLEYFFAGEIHLRRRAVVKLDGKSVGLIGRRQLQGHRRIFLISVIEEQHVISCEQAAEQAVTECEAQLQNLQQKRVAVQSVDEAFGRRTVERHPGIMTRTTTSQTRSPILIPCAPARFRNRPAP